jgi:hypothetical protein
MKKQLAEDIIAFTKPLKKKLLNWKTILPTSIK